MPQSEVEPATRSGPARILVVEDQALIRFAIAEALRELGVSVVEAASGEEAWQYLTAGGSVDLVFSDHRMPGSITGGQLATRIRRQYPSLVIVTSAYFDDRAGRNPLSQSPTIPTRSRLPWQSGHVTDNALLSFFLSKGILRFVILWPNICAKAALLFSRHRTARTPSAH
jgi:CheY-like chemotaxis protein